MDYPRFPDWLIYGAVAGAIFTAALSRRERADAPQPPPPPPGAERVPLGVDSPFAPVSVVRTSPRDRARGAAVSVSGEGLWLTARGNLRGCRNPAVKVAEGRAVRAVPVRDPDRQMALLRTPGGPPGIAVENPVLVQPGVRAFLIGFASSGPGEVSSGLLAHLPGSHGRNESPGVLAWAETGRTDGLGPAPAGLIGGPLLDAGNRVAGIVIGFEPRRGRILSTRPEALRAMLERAKVRPEPATAREPITPANYGRIADELRRGRQVVQVLCLKGSSGS